MKLARTSAFGTFVIYWLAHHWKWGDSFIIFIHNYGPSTLGLTALCFLIRIQRILPVDKFECSNSSFRCKIEIWYTGSWIPSDWCLLWVGFDLVWPCCLSSFVGPWARHLDASSASLGVSRGGCPSVAFHQDNAFWTHHVHILHFELRNTSASAVVFQLSTSLRLWVCVCLQSRQDATLLSFEAPGWKLS